MGDAPENRKGNQPPSSEFAPEFNDLQTPSDNAFFREYSQDQGAPSARSDVSLPAGNDMRVVVDGQEVTAGRVEIGKVENLTIIMNGREVPQSVARFERVGQTAYDEGYYPGDPRYQVSGNRPLYGRAAEDAFYAHRGQHVSNNRHRAYMEPGPRVYHDRSVVAGGPNGVYFENGTTVVNGDGRYVDSRPGWGPRETVATVLGVLNSPGFEAIVNRGDSRYGRHVGNPRVVNFPIGRYGTYGGDYIGTPPYVPPHVGRGGGRVVVMNDGGPAPTVYDRQSTTYGGPGGVVFSDNTTVVNGGGVPPEQQGMSGRDWAATAVALLHTPVIADAIGGGRNDHRRYRGNDDYYAQREAMSRRADAMARRADAMRRSGGGNNVNVRVRLGL